MRLLTFLFAVILLSTTAFAQNLTDLPMGYGGQFYRGNPVSIRLQYADIITSVKSVLRKGKGLAPLPQQATIKDSTASGVTLYWPTSQDFPSDSWLEIILNGRVAAAGTVSVGYSTNVARSDTMRFGGIATSPTLVLYVTALGGNNSQFTKYYPVNGVSRNYILPSHNLNSKLITGYFIRSDNNLVDHLWYPVWLSNNQAILKGPPNETATGTVVLNIYLR